MKDKIFLLNVADGPEGIQVYVDEEEGVVDWSDIFPAVYLVASICGTSVKLGPFQLRGIYEQLVKALQPSVKE